MKERPILFSAPMVKALLAGTKTQTRRVVRIPEIVRSDDDQASDFTTIRKREDGSWRAWMTEYPEEGSVDLAATYGLPGDRLWVRETWCYEYKSHGSFLYRATSNEASFPASGGWRPSIFMPRAACRITLEITDVRVERLQEIAAADVLAEGFIRGKASGRYALTTSGIQLGEHWPTAGHAYRELWDSLNAKRAPWASNPWVWVLTFREWSLRQQQGETGKP